MIIRKKILPLPTVERVREVFRYDPETGIFTRKYKTKECVVGYPRKKGGYVLIGLDYDLHLAHRLAWLYMTGKWPLECVDHIDGDPSNNRWSNLRAATQSQNMANARKPTHNTSGLKGASFCKDTGRWRALVTKEGRHYCFGRHDTPEQAHAAYCTGVRRLFGEFARDS